MAYGSNPGNPGPPGDYFEGGNMASPEEKGEGEHNEPHETGILPKSLMAGKDFKVGEEIVLKITAIHEKDFEVEYSYDEGSEKGEGGDMAEAPSGGGEGGMSSYME